MDNDWQNIIKKYKRVKSGKILFIKASSKIIEESLPKIQNKDDYPELSQTSKSDFKKFTPQYKLDLHGCNKNQALRELKEFITLNYKRSNRELLIITGKSNRDGSIGVLKSNFHYWLNDKDIRFMIASYCQASVKDGGEGAFYIKLKNNS